MITNRIFYIHAGIFFIFMTIDTINQIIEKVNSTNNYLIVLPASPSGDTIAAGLALQEFLKKLDKEVTVISPTAPDPRFSFLKGFDSIQTQLNVVKNFVIEVSTKRTELDELSYKKDADKLSIFLKPKNGEFRDADVSFANANFPYGLIIAVGVASLERLEHVYGTHAEMFFQTPVVNIDFRADNETFGQYNLVQVNSTSVSEVAMDLIVRFEESMIDESIATSLLAGIISETNSFQHTRTAPQTFLKASQLVSIGARQQDIVNQLYKNKSFGMLKLWGRALARIKQVSEMGLVYTFISESDIVKSQAKDSDVESILPEMVTQLKTSRIFMVLHETSATSSEAFVQLPPSVSPVFILRDYSPKATGPHAVRINLPYPIAEAEQKLIETLKKELAPQNSQ
jgi:bifunctional oligoribonuclease and PAP phosphatase NrnA